MDGLSKWRVLTWQSTQPFSSLTLSVSFALRRSLLYRDSRLQRLHYQAQVSHYLSLPELLEYVLLSSSPGLSPHRSKFFSQIQQIRAYGQDFFGANHKMHYSCKHFLDSLEGVLYRDVDCQVPLKVFHCLIPHMCVSLWTWKSTLIFQLCWRKSALLLYQSRIGPSVLFQWSGRDSVRTLDEKLSILFCKRGLKFWHYTNDSLTSGPSSGDSRKWSQENHYQDSRNWPFAAAVVVQDGLTRGDGGLD